MAKKPVKSKIQRLSVKEMLNQSEANDKKASGQLYPQHNSEALGEYYQRHYTGIAERGLLKRRIEVAVQLAWRDQEIEKLNARVKELEEAQAGGKEPDKGKEPKKETPPANQSTTGAQGNNASPAKPPEATPGANSSSS